ncbi:MAG: cobalt ECF transporter T component CbiQ [Deltaproteobacteria bacterium]|nr:cobalt ECF transporter T component CbiQ [Deltaproteobacteria bacterium]
MNISESFSEGNSIIHRLDPRVRVISAFAFSLVISLSDRLQPVFLGLVISIVITVAARLPVKTFLVRILYANIFILFLWLFIPFSMKGEPIIQVGQLDISLEGLIYCLLLTVKSNAIIIALAALTATMPVFTMGRAMGALRFPSKIVNLFIFSYRYIHTIMNEYRRLKEAMEIRGFRPGTNLHTYRSYAYLAGMLIVKSHDRAERVYSAMLCRGFQGRFYDLTMFNLRGADFIFIIIFIFSLAAIILVE